MFKTLRGAEKKEKELNHSGRSQVGETMQLEGDLRSSGSIDISGLINGNVFVSEIAITETGSVRGLVEASKIEISGHVEGKISADIVIVGKSAVIKGDIFFKNTLKTEDVLFTLADSNSSALIEGAGDEEAMYVVMPMRL